MTNFLILGKVPKRVIIIDESNFKKQSKTWILINRKIFALLILT